MDCLRKILTAIYAYYDKDAEIYTEAAQEQCKSRDATETDNENNPYLADTVVQSNQLCPRSSATVQTHTNEHCITGPVECNSMHTDDKEYEVSFNEEEMITSTPSRPLNWRLDEDDPCVKDYVRGYLTPVLKRNRAPRKCFTPSDYH